MKRNIMIAVLLAWAVLIVVFIGSTRVTGQAPQTEQEQEQQSQGEVATDHATQGVDNKRLPIKDLLSELERIRQGFRVAPVPLNLQGKDPDLVGLGSYIVNGPGVCIGCHTNPTYVLGGNPFLGQPEQLNVERYLAGGTAFGPFISRNLTPDAEGRPAGLTFRQFRRAIRTGADLKHLPPHVPSAERDILQVMPWPAYSKMIDRDIRAIYEYLKAIPSRPGFPRDPVQ